MSMNFFISYEIAIFFNPIEINKLPRLKYRIKREQQTEENDTEKGFEIL